MQKIIETIKLDQLIITTVIVAIVYMFASVVLRKIFLVLIEAIWRNKGVIFACLFVMVANVAISGWCQLNREVCVAVFTTLVEWSGSMQVLQYVNAKYADWQWLGVDKQK